ALSSWKLHADNAKADSVAKIGIETIETQLRTYEKRPEKSAGFSEGWVLLAFLVVGVGIAAVVKSRRK
ncbi:MAG: hypothetical protein ACKPCP_23190, partial [Sphaerospermopsis kisseleviana]